MLYVYRVNQNELRLEAGGRSVMIPKGKWCVLEHLEHHQYRVINKGGKPYTFDTQEEAQEFASSLQNWLNGHKTRGEGLKALEALLEAY